MAFCVLTRRFAALAALAALGTFSGADDVDLDADNELMRVSRLIGNIITSTTTVLKLSTVSTTVPVTCLENTFPATACTGRRRRRRNTVADDPDELHDVHRELATELHGSLADLSEGHQDDERTKRLFLFATRFVTVDNLATSFTTFTDQSTTVSISLLCTVAGQNLITRRCVTSTFG